MSKEEIIDKHIKDYTETIGNCPDEIEAMMDEYAKQEAIAFRDWTKEVAIKINLSRWYNDEPEYTTKQLYELYKIAQQSDTTKTE